jgi:HEAT repeat protein
MIHMVSKCVSLLMVLTFALAAGCGASKSEPAVQKVLPRPKQAPRPPAPVQMAINPALQEESRQVIRQLLGHPDPVVRANAIEASQRALGIEARLDILRGMEDRNALVRFAACMAAGELRMKDAKPFLQKLAEDPSNRVKIGARFALHRIGDTRLSHDMEQMARSQNVADRADTVMALGLLGEPSAVRILRVTTNDREAVVRLQTAEAMWRLGQRDGLEALIAASVSADPADQIVALLALAAPRDKRVIQHVRAQLTADYTEVALAAARAMGQLGSDEGYAIAVEGTRSTDPRQRLLAALALGAIGRRDAQPYLAPLLKSEDPGVRLAAATALLQLGRGATG